MAQDAKTDKSEEKIGLSAQAAADLEFGLELRGWRSGICDWRDDYIFCCFVHCCPCCIMCSFVEKLAPFDLSCFYVSERSGWPMAIAVVLAGGLDRLLVVAIAVVAGGAAAGFGVLGPVTILLMYFLAQGIKDKLNIEESSIITFIKACYCPWCFLIQIYKEGDDPDEVTDKRDISPAYLLEELVKLRPALEEADHDDPQVAMQTFHAVVKRSRLLSETFHESEAASPDDVIDDILTYKEYANPKDHQGELIYQAMRDVMDILNILSLKDQESSGVCAIEKLSEATNFIEEEQEDGVRNHQFAQWLKEERKHGLACRTLPLTIVTWAFFIFVAIYHANIRDTYRMRECLQEAILEIKAKHVVSGIGQDVKSVVNLTSVTSVEEMWSWIEGGLVPAMAGSPLKPGFVRTFNQVIGQIQLRESRYLPGECQVGKELEAFYRQGCHKEGEISSTAYGMGTGNATSVTSSLDRDPAFLAGYGLGGRLDDFNKQRFFSWLDITRPDYGKERANMLRTSKWVDTGTVMLEVLIVLYNAEIQTYAHISVKLMLQRGGLIKVELDVQTMWAAMWKEWYHMLFDILWALCVMKFLANSIQQCVDNRGRLGGCVRNCCKLPKHKGGGWWLGLDWLGILLAFTIMAFVPILLLGYGDLAKKVGGLSDPLSGNTTDPELYYYPEHLGGYYATNAEIIQNIESLILLKVIHRLAMYWYGMCFLLRWFRGFSGQSKMAQITATLHSCIADVFHFAVIFGVLFVNFALAGHVLFGAEVNEWSTITKALQSGLAMAWGRVDYTPLYEIAPISSMIWLAGYVMSMVFVSMNMLLAIISDHYGVVFHKNKAGDAGHDLIGQMKAMLFDFWWHVSYEFRHIYRLAARKMSSRVVNSRAMPKYAMEEKRIPIPYEDIYACCKADPMSIITVKGLRDFGCDRSTAEHLYQKCVDEVTRHLDENYPLELLFDEFDGAMHRYYDAMDHFTADLRGWFVDKTTAAKRMIPRQDILTRETAQIEKAQHIEHKHHHHHSAKTLEGEGHHHHHHRTHHSEHESRSHGSHSQSQSRNLSRAPSSIRE